MAQLLLLNIKKEQTFCYDYIIWQIKLLSIACFIKLYRFYIEKKNDFVTFFYVFLSRKIYSEIIILYIILYIRIFF